MIAMKSQMRRVHEFSAREAGFTLVELMVVVAIIAILAAIGLPKMTAFIKTSETSEAIDQSGRIVKAINGFIDTHPDVPDATLSAAFDPTDRGNLGGANSQLSLLIPHLTLATNAEFTYKIDADVSGDTTAVCITAFKSGEDGTNYLLFSSLASTSLDWENYVYRATYLDDDVTTVTTAGGYCTTAGAATTTDGG